MTAITKNNAPDNQPAAQPEIGPSRALWLRMRRHRGLMIGFGMVSTLILLAIFAPLISPHDPYDMVLADRLIPPIWTGEGSWAYPFGTDHLGRDYLSRLLHGSRISLTIGFFAASIGCVIGVTMGVMAGYFGGRIDQVATYILNCQLALPGLLFAMALVAFVGPSLIVVICVLGVLQWTLFLVITRTATMQIRQLEYTKAARAIGCSERQIIFKEILPNVLNQIIVVFTLEVGLAIISEASLSFLGVGVQAPLPSWGLMIAEGKELMFLRPWLVLIPGIVLFLLVIAINLMGDGMRDVTAPENRR